jgi:hypothetical protein
MKNKKTIDITGTIVISKNHKEVFEYFSNFTNDTFWRKEINETKVNTGRIELNSIISQDSFLSKRIPHHIAIYKCKELLSNKSIIIETTNENSFWQNNSRQITELSENTTEVIYRIQFDFDIVKYGLGFGLPKSLVNFYTKITMNKYLSKLKTILEK